MPRIRQYMPQYAAKDFTKSIRRALLERDMYQKDLTASSGIPQSTLSKRLKQPEDFTVGELQKVVKAIAPDIAVLLTLLGYDSKQIKKFREPKKEET